MEFMMEAIQKSMVLNQHQQSHFRTVFLSPSLCLKKKKKTNYTSFGKCDIN